MHVADIARVLGSELSVDAYCSGFSIDTRTLRPGQIFVAFKGANVDGHDYIAEAKNKGALAVIVERSTDVVIDQIRVISAMDALVTLAKYYRSCWTDVQVLALTGSAGKTTTKEMLAAIMSEVGPVHATKANNNNLLGLAITILNKPKDVKRVVLELGINAPGEMAILADMARPDVALITNIGSCHLEGLHNEETIAFEKSFLFAAVPADGIVLIDEASPFKSLFQKRACGKNIAYYSRNPGKANWYADVLEPDNAVCYRWRLYAANKPLGSIKLSIPGLFQVSNALCAAVMAQAVGVGVAAIASALESFVVPDFRFSSTRLSSGALLMEDCYNANPYALQAVLQCVRDMPQKQKCLVLGDMYELGDQAAYWYKVIAEKLRVAYGITHLYTVGDASRIMHAFYTGESAAHFHNHDGLLLALTATAKKADLVILMKGSRALALDKVSRRLKEGVGVA
ncbi:MAG: UDP-N-acetylmuramoyl-tripeptide--D-alanyl-D-alanine ligase [Pseudomonadota bacterium]|nr:UDP-N-acetylmuramoyl-tripeptide--D-alanyl-D-alanine ligase [Pseudomonadota bacterium]